MSAPRNNAQRESPSANSVAAVVKEALEDTALASTNAAAVSLLLARAEDEAVSAHMTDGALRSLADELIRTCQDLARED